MLKHTALAGFKYEKQLAQMKNPSSLSQREQQVQQILHWVGNMVLQMRRGWLTPQDNVSEVSCPHCQGTAQYERQRWGVWHTRFGELRYRRAYYLCGMCQRGHYPLDEQLELRPNAMSAEVERLAGLVGVQMPFEQGRAILAELALIELSDHSLAKATPSYGQRVVQQEAPGQCIAQEADYLHQQAQQTKPPLRLYGTLDGGQIPTRPTTTDPQRWRELKVGAWFTARGQPPRHPAETWTIRAQDIPYYADPTPRPNLVN